MRSLIISFFVVFCVLSLTAEGQKGQFGGKDSKSNEKVETKKPVTSTTLKPMGEYCMVTSVKHSGSPVVQDKTIECICNVSASVYSHYECKNTGKPVGIKPVSLGWISEYDFGRVCKEKCAALFQSTCFKITKTTPCPPSK